jgi:LPXTG-motif cell wall-anchored protein
VEKVSPAGYCIENAETTFTISNGQVTDSSLEPEAGSQEIAFEIPNTPGAALPNTGGPGTRIFTILGSILILGAGVLLWRRRRLI